MIPEINLKVTTVKVETYVRKLRTKIKVVMGTPTFGIHKSCRKSLGLSNPIKYWLWRRKMKKKWNNGR